jgi:hypothetical protein
MLSDAQREQIQDIARLIPEDERQAFLGMLSHELRGRELADGELRRIAERAWRDFLRHGRAIHGPEDVA